MVRSRYDWTQAKFERYVKEGRGKGRGKDYKPWITVQDGSLVPVVISQAYTNKQANSFSRKDSKVLKP